MSVPVGCESSYCQHAGGQLFPVPMVTQHFVSQNKAHVREMVNYFLMDVAQVYRVYMTWELALNAAMGMKRILVLGPDQNLVPIGVTKLYCDFQLDTYMMGLKMYDGPFRTVA